MDKVIMLAVGGAVAVGTVLYYLLTREKEEPMRRKGGRSESPPTQRTRHRSPPIEYSDVKPVSSRKRKSVPSSSKVNTSKTSCPEPDKESGKNPKLCGSPSPTPGETQNDPQSSQEIADNSYSISAVCRACGAPANVTLQPCKHRVFCNEHAEYYFKIAKDYKLPPRCPTNNCHRVLEYFTV